MIRTAVFALSILINLCFKQVNDVPIHCYKYKYKYTRYLEQPKKTVSNYSSQIIFLFKNTRMVPLESEITMNIGHKYKILRVVLLLLIFCNFC